MVSATRTGPALSVPTRSLLPQEAPEGENITDQLIIGSSTQRLPHENGRRPGQLLGICLDLPQLSVDDIEVLAVCQNPSYLAVSLHGDHVYAVNETEELDGVAGGGVSAYRRDKLTGHLTFLNARSSGGSHPCHVVISPDKRFVIAANYTSGSVTVLPIRDDGSLAPATCCVQHSGGSQIGTERQGAPHPHMVCPDPATGKLLVPDLGLDKIFVYDLSEEGKLIEAADHHFSTPRGSGPRHVAFHSSGNLLFVVNELDNTVLSLCRVGTGFTPVSVASTLPARFEGPSSAAAIKVSRSGRHVLVSNRGHDSVAVFLLDEPSGRLTLRAVERTRGHEPRDLCLTPDGRGVIVAIHGSSTLTVFELNEETSTLTFQGQRHVGSPLCLAFCPRLPARSPAPGTE